MNLTAAGKASDSSPLEGVRKTWRQGRAAAGDRWLRRWECLMPQGWQILRFTPEGAMTPLLRGAGWSLEFPNKVPIQGKEHKIPRQLGLREAVLSDIENRFRAQSGHTIFVIFYQCCEKPTFFSLPTIFSSASAFYLSDFFQVLALPTLSNHCGCREHELILISAWTRHHWEGNQRSYSKVK